jgi:hypothetical protein
MFFVRNYRSKPRNVLRNAMPATDGKVNHWMPGNPGKPPPTTQSGKVGARIGTLMMAPASVFALMRRTGGH